MLISRTENLNTGYVLGRISRPQSCTAGTKNKGEKEFFSCFLGSSAVYVDRIVGFVITERPGVTGVLLGNLLINFYAVAVVVVVVTVRQCLLWYSECHSCECYR